MVYDWEGKQEICYQMYIKEKKALEEIMEYMKQVHHFAPSKRAFQTQFKRWGFPSKQNPAHKNAGLVAKIKELWESNKTQRDMLQILKEEGYNIKERELMRVRAKNRWLLRVPNGMKSQRETQSITRQPPEDNLLVFEQTSSKPAAVSSGESELNQSATDDQVCSDLSLEVLARRKERLEERKAESAELLVSRKRRRRTRGWAGLPADPPGPPRFPSETTIDESKQYLNLDKSVYRHVRDHFQRICEEDGFLKKTVAGPERWRAAKNRLIRESPQLQAVFWSDPNQQDAKALALDIVCTDVTKRMRTLERRMTIAEAKNALGINPEESRQIREAFYNTLEADHFTSKLEAGDEHWKDLKEQWIRQCDLLQRILAPGYADPQHATKVKALEVLCRDVMKRLRDDQAKRVPRDKYSASQLPYKMAISNSLDSGYGSTIDNGISTLASQALASTPIAASDLGEMQIDPSLLEAANNPSFVMTSRP